VASVQEFLESVGQNSAAVSLLAVAEHCAVKSPVSLRALMEGGCRTTVKVALRRQEVGVAMFPPYLGELHGNGKLKEITVPNAGGFLGNLVGISFVKGGHNTDECGDAEAVVFASAGSTLDEDKIKEIFGGSVPSVDDANPVFFVACVVTKSAFPESVTITVTLLPVPS